MILSSFDNTLKQLAADKTLMANATCFNVVKDLMAMVASVQSLAMSNQGAVADMLQMNISAKLVELESIISMFGMQRLAQFGGGQMQQPQPFMPNTQMHNQSFYYPPMGMGMGQMPQQMQQPVQQSVPVQPQVAPQPVPQPAPQPQVVQQPQPVPQTQLASQPVNNGESVVGFSALPGMEGGGNGKPAVGRDYILKLLNE